MISATGRTTPCTATGRNQARAAVAKSAPIIQASGTWARVNSAPPAVAAMSVVRWVVIDGCTALHHPPRYARRQTLKH